MTTTNGSRIIVKNLPKWISEDRLRSHFGVKGQITDLKMMHTRSGVFRRFAYIGFASTDEAALAVKYFDRTFIDTLRIQVEFAQRIGSEQLNRPWSKYSSGSSAHEEHLRRKAEKVKAAAKEGKERTKSQIEENLERKKRLLQLIYEDEKEDEQLCEFVAAMRPASKTKVWENDSVNIKNEASSFKKGSQAKKVETFVVPDKRIGDKGNLVTRVHVKFDSEDDDGQVGRIRNEDASSNDDDYQDFLPTQTIDIDNFSDPEKNHENKDGEFEKAPFDDIEKDGADSLSEDAPMLSADLIADTGRLFIRNLSYSVTEEELQRLFEPFGPLSEVHLSISRETRKPKGFAHVLFMFPDHALRAYSQLDGSIFLGRILHILPAKEKPSKETNDDQRGSNTCYKSQKEKEQKATAQSDYNWNSLFLRTDTVLDAIAAKLGVAKSAIMDVQSENLASRLAIAETNLIQETKSCLEQAGVKLDAFVPGKERSTTIILVKNLPFETETIELRKLFSKFGVVGRVILPPTKAVALIEFFEPSEARSAFRSLAYSKFKHVPLFLEWAPIESLCKGDHMTPLTTEQVSAIALPKDDFQVANNEDPSLTSSTTLYIKNLNFSTSSDTLKTVFSTMGAVRSAKVATKKSNGKELSLGFGFVEFERCESLNRALDELQGHVIDGHAILLKKSAVRMDAQPTRRTERVADTDKDLTNTKLVVRNVPFEATEKEVRELFKSFAQLKRVRLPRRYDGRHRGFGFVDFLTHQEALNAKTALAHTHLYGRHLVLEWAKPEQEGDEQIEGLRKKSKSSIGKGSQAAGGGSRKRIKIGASTDMDDTATTIVSDEDDA